MTEPDLATDVRRRLFELIPALTQLRGSEKFHAEQTIEREVELALVDYARTIPESMGEPDCDE